MKTFDSPLVHNPFETRSDLQEAFVQLFEPLKERYTQEGAGLHLGNTAAHYSDRTATMEGWCRVLWGLAPFLAGGGSSPLAAKHLEGLRFGTNPRHPAFWGEPGEVDQRCVEMAAISLGLLLAPQFFWDPLDSNEKENLRIWLGTINHHGLVENNWQFFRVLVNLALLRVNQPHDEAALEASLTFLDTLYVEDGWYSDGMGGDFDLYNPFALHFYGLIYARFRNVEDPIRCLRYRDRARAFARQFLPWFHSDGSCIPFGRSLTYRFAAVSFFSACAFAGEEVLPWSIQKGIVLRNLRWWFSRPILDHEGVLTIGYGYPNLVMAEQYNSPGSPYWGLKTFLVLALDEAHPFWTSQEEQLPPPPPVFREGVPSYVIQRTAFDTVLLNAGHYRGYEIIQKAAKYSKFAYSARLGFCVSHGAYGLEKTGCDSTLLLSQSDGWWRERRESLERTSGESWVYSSWYPWPETEVRTWLVALGEWQVRIHRVETQQSLELVEGGFSAPYSHGFEPESPRQEEDARRTRIGSETGGSACFEGYGATSLIVGLEGERLGAVVAVEPNLNLIFPLVRVPVLRAKIGPGSHWFVCAVWAGEIEKLSSIKASVPSFRFETSASRLVVESADRKSSVVLKAGRISDE